MLIEEYYLDWEDDIENHPGVKPQHSFLYFDDYFFCIEPEPGRRLGQAKVNWHFEADKEKWRERYGCIPDPKKNDEKKDEYIERQNKHKDFLERRKNRVERLNNVLVSLSASIMDARIPVVSIGSYGIPSRLRQLYKSKNVSVNSFIPVFQADLVGFNYVYATNITDKGSIRVVPVYSPSRENKCTTRAHVMFMNKEQLEKLQINDTYKLVKIDAKSESKFQHARLEILDSGEILYHFYIYSCNDQPLALDKTRREWVAAPSNVTEVVSSDLGEEKISQEKLLEKLLPLWNDYAGPPTPSIYGYKECYSVRGLRKNLEADTKVKKGFKEFLENNHTRLIVSGDFLSLKLPESDLIPSVCKTYAQIRTTWKRPLEGGVRVTPTEYDQKGDFIVVLPVENFSLAEQRTLPSHVILQRTKYSSKNTPQFGYSVIGKLILDLKSNERRGARVSMTLRSAIGIEVGENIDIDIGSLKIPPHDSKGNYIQLWNRLSDLIIPRRYLMTRLQRGEPTMIEIGACLVQSETLQVLGIESGDYIVLEGIDKQNRLLTRRLRAYEIPDDVAAQRKVLEKNIEDALFPDCSEKLGVFPDLDPIMLDEEARLALNLELCAPVRVRASRSHQASKETRNFLFLVLITLIGAVGVFFTETAPTTNPEPIIEPLVIVIGLIGLGLGVIWLGLRARLKP